MTRAKLRAIRWAIIGGILFIVGIVAAVWILSDSYSRLNKTIQKQQIEIRKAIDVQIDSVLKDRKAIQNKIDSLQTLIEKQDIQIKQQIDKFKYETFQNLRNYRDSSNSAILDRLRTK